MSGRAVISSRAAGCSAATCRRRSGRRWRRGWVVSLVGDGGAMYSPQALWSAAHYRARVIFVVFNNRRYGVLQNVALAGLRQRQGRPVRRHGDGRSRDRLFGAGRVDGRAGERAQDATRSAPRSRRRSSATARR